VPPPKQKPTAALRLLSPMPRFSASATSVLSAALMRLRPSTRSARTDIINSPDSGGPLLVLPLPYMSTTKATYLSPAICCARLIAMSVTPSQFGATSSNGRLPLIFSFQTSAPFAVTLPA
jgi:hypothetical protein